MSKYLRLHFASGLLAAILMVSFLYFTHAHASTSSGWLLPATLNLQKEAESQTPTSISGNIDCFQEDTFSCVVSTPYGLVNTNSAVKINGSKSYVPISTYVDNHAHFIAVPNSSTFISYITEPPYGFYLYFNSIFSGSLTHFGQQYQINQPPNAKLTDKNNHSLAADYSSMSFSENGQWMVVSEPNVAVLRVNLQTFEVTPFAPGLNYTIGLDPAPKTAISNDGRYVVVESKDFGRFNIYDLDTCSQTPSTINGSDDCQARDLQVLANSQIVGYISANNIRFISDDSLSFYANYAQGSSHLTAKYILSNGAGTIHQLDYLGLGDSYISGEGAYNYQPGTDTDDNTCHLSLSSYPYLLGHDLNYSAYHSVACSGATTQDIADTSGSYLGQAKPGVKRQNRGDQVGEILTNFQPGYIDQLDFVSTYQPKSITISIGGNDIGFSARLRSCLGTGTCYSTYEERLAFVREVNSKFQTLVNTYTKLKQAGTPDARIYVIGYPQIAKVGGDCALNVHMNNDELIFAQQAISYLDTVIQAAANKAGVAYVDTQNALNGHRLCEAGPGSVAMNGVTAGNDFPDKLGGPIGRENYHPNDFGHELLEQAILQKTQNMTEPMPAANLSSAPPAEAGLDILNLPHSGDMVNTTEYDSSLSDDVIYKQSLTNLSVNGTEHSLPPAASMQVTLHSDEVLLGNYPTDKYGNLSIQIVIPDSVSAGYHTLHFKGTDVSGQTVDVYKIVYVADSPTDWDGDGIPDNTQVCVGLRPSGQDTDKDGIDDSCDPMISEPPMQQGPVNIGISTQTQVVAGTMPQSTNAASQRAGSSISKQSIRSQVPTKTQVLADKTIKSDAPILSESKLFTPTDLPNPKVLMASAGAGIFIALSYAAWKFRG